MNTFGIIPARYASTRLPGKPLALIAGKPMIQWVYENASKSKLLEKIIIATDDKRIFYAVKDFGGDVVMTNNNHKSGTDRCFEVVEKLSFKDGIIVNIQGDEPFINALQIDKLVALFNDDEVDIATLIHPLHQLEDYENKNRVKVQTDENGFAKSFSRIDKAAGFLHIGMYAYRTNVLDQLVKLLQTENEISNSLEQLRWLDNGYKIKTALIKETGLSVDTHEDLQKAREIAKAL